MLERDLEYEKALRQVIEKELEEITQALKAADKLKPRIEFLGEQVEVYKSMQRACEREARELRIHAECCMGRVAEAKAKLQSYEDYLEGVRWATVEITARDTTTT